jgi:hypothetical protein
MIIGSVILTGLFNLLLSIYSARDIKAKQGLGKKNAQVQTDETNHMTTLTPNPNPKVLKDNGVPCFDIHPNSVVECVVEEGGDYRIDVESPENVKSQG